MKIEKIILENFSAIKNAMNSKKIEIDFSQSIHKICLLIGPNGSGKTTILSLLNPFADLGNLDIRNGHNLILKDKDGYKEIHIRKGEDLYIIKHFYTHHKDKSHSIKSYIEKNGNELNVNGNVTSFKEYVKMELQIEPDYLKLIRLGSNVTSLIDLTSTERKNYMSKIMDDIGIYLFYYKSVNTKLRQLDEMISHTIDKINKLNILDEKNAENEIDELQKEKDKINKNILNFNNNIAVTSNKIISIDDVESIQENVNIINKKYNKMKNILEKKDKLDSLDIKYYEEKILDLEKELLTNKNEVNTNILLIENTLNHLNTEQEQFHNYEIQLKKELESDAEIERMNNNLRDTRKRINEFEDIFNDYEPKYTKEEFESFVLFLKNTQQILSRTYEFGKLPISKVIELMRNKKNVVNYINSHLLELDDEVDQKGSLFINKISSLLFSKPGEKIIIDCKNECKAKDVFIQLQNIIENSIVTDKNEDSSFYHDMNFVYQNLIAVLPQFKDYEGIIKVLPDDVRKDFELDNIYTNIEKLKLIYNEKRINELLTLITEYDNYINLKEKYKNDSNSLSVFAGNSKSDYLIEQIEITKNLILEEKEKILTLKNRNAELSGIISDNEKTLEILKEVKEALEEFDTVKVQYEKINNDYEEYKKLREDLNDFKLELSKLQISFDNIEKELKDKENNLYLYKSLTKELNKFNKLFDEMTFVKEALSSKKGMPLHIISSYLNNTEAITNELLDIAYDGKIFIDKFNITPTEFSIPFYNNGVRLEDVKYASQGELSFLSIALSFALSSQALSKYNIMLLDEIDGPLDTVNREKFIQILENQIDRIDSEQNFLITHNAMFSSYPVDIIDLSKKKNLDQYPLANFINIKYE